ncbi:metallophosphoesterase [Allopusillimonas ginsengisoli]|uniref:metallophosphoesterase n=1 Tax=Allopusillimonas ginsengisoli TaxID=453575 RepID=UPI001431201F|nr:metallophosphoesterase [Allopusillimonas ginsengisoli]
MTKLHIKIPANTRGRDFIIGDLHGCLDLLEAEMDRHQFDPDADRMLSVGDLADRGPDAMGCLRLLNQPWFHAVRGNHEDMLLGYLPPSASSIKPSPGAGALLMRNGGAWVDALTTDELIEIKNIILPKVAELPYVITVGDGNQQFHIAHAELMTTGAKEEKAGFWRRLTGARNGKREGRRIVTDTMLDDSLLAEMTEPIMWGRRLIQQVDEAASRIIDTPQGPLMISQNAHYPGLSLTYVGHTPVSQMTLHASHLYVDRGAYLRSADSELLMVDHKQVLGWLGVG